MANSMNKAWEEAMEGKGVIYEALAGPEHFELRLEAGEKATLIDRRSDTRHHEAEAEQTEDRATKRDQ